MAALPSRILIISLRRIGDLLLTTPVIRSIRRAWPGAEIDVLVFDGSAGIIAGNPDIDRILTMPQRPTAAESLRLIWRLWRSYDIAVSTQSGDRPTVFAFAAGRWRVGVTTYTDPWLARALKRACKPWIGICRHPDTPTAGGESEDGRSISALCGYRDVVRAPQAPDQSQAFRRRRSLRHREDTVDVGVSGNNSRAAVEHQHVDFRPRPSATNAADHRRRQQQVADAAQRDDQDAGGERGHANFSQNRNYRSMAVRPTDLSDCRRDSRNACCCAFS